MEMLYYICEVICQAWPVILIMGMVAIPILWIWFEEDNEFEALDEYYNPSADDDEKEKLKNNEH